MTRAPDLLRLAGASAAISLAVLLGGAGTALAAPTCNGLTPTIVDPAGDGPGTINGTSGADVIMGLGGDDLILGFDGDDTICGGEGADLILGNGDSNPADGNDAIFGESGDDQISGDDGNDILRGGDGSDTILGASGNDDIDGGAGDDSNGARTIYLSGDDGNDIVSGGSGSDEVDGGPDSDQLSGGDGIDLILGNGFGGPDGDDQIFAGLGDDVVLAEGGSDTILGGDGNDVLLGNDGTANPDGGDEINGENGADQVLGGAGDDILLGADGRDLIGGEDGDDHIDGGPGDDFQSDPNGPLDAGLFGEAGQDEIEGSDGNDFIDGGDDADVLGGGQGSDLVDGGSGADHIDGGPGDESDPAGLAGLVGNAGADEITGSGGKDLIVGGPDPDSIAGGDGNDTLAGGSGGDSMDGGDGQDSISFSVAGAAVTADLQAHEATVEGDAKDTILNAEELVGSPFDDHLFGDASPNKIAGLGGNDEIDGRGSADGDLVNYADSPGAVVVDLSAGSGDDRAAKAIGHDTLTRMEGVIGSSQDDILTGDQNPNTFIPRAGNDIVDGVGGGNTVDYEDATGGVTVQLPGHVADGPSSGHDTLTAVQNVIGSDDNDTLVGDESGNAFTPGGGDDVVDGGDPAEESFDQILYFGASGPVHASLASGSGGGPGAGEDRFSNIEGLSGTEGNDVLIGDDRPNALFGEEGADELYGKGASDTFDGGSGTDRIYGGAGSFNSVAFGSATDGVTVDLAAGTASIGEETDHMTGIQTVFGTRFADTLMGDAGENFFIGGLGGDTLDGREALDWAGYSTNPPVIDESASSGGSSATGPITADVGNHAVFDATDGSTDSLEGIEAIIGSPGDDTLVGDDQTNFLLGDDGNDRIFGAGGDDLFDGGAGSDKLNGGPGQDYATYTVDATGPITATLAHHSIAEHDGTGAQIATDEVTSLELIGGTDFGDTMIGAPGHDILIGEAGDDHLRGKEGNDTLEGRDGSDRLNGGAGKDNCVDRKGTVRRKCESRRLPPRLAALIAVADAFRDADGNHGHGRHVGAR